MSDNSASGGSTTVGNWNSVDSATIDNWASTTIQG